MLPFARFALRFSTPQPPSSVPATEVSILKDGEFTPLDTAQLFGTGKNVVFALPGAFTPGTFFDIILSLFLKTCS